MTQQLQQLLLLPLDEAPRTAEELLARLRAAGLRGIARCRLTTNRTVMVSYRGEELRIHRGYLAAPPEVLRAVALFVCGRTRAERRAAQRLILRFQVPGPTRPPVRRPDPARPADAPVVRELQAWHRTYNQRHFGGALREIRIRLSARMRSRLGQYTAASTFGEPAEITISRAHLRRHGWAEVLHTLLHEMVHQWQAESGLAIDHGTSFRAKAREVGVAPRARRDVRPRDVAAHTGRLLSPQEELLLRAARSE